MPIYLGVDPGARGGIAWVYHPPLADTTHSDILVTTLPMPQTERDVWEAVSSVKADYAIVERVGGYIRSYSTRPTTGAESSSLGPGEDNVAQGPQMFRFGVSCGMLRMALTAAGIPWQDCDPQRWQRTLGIPPRRRRRREGRGPNAPWVKGETTTEWKQRLRAVAQSLFPGVKVTLATADALLLAEYARRVHMGQIVYSHPSKDS